MHIRTKLFAMMIFAALASAGLIFGLFFLSSKRNKQCSGRKFERDLFSILVQFIYGRRFLILLI